MIFHLNRIHINFVIFSMRPYKMNKCPFDVPIPPSGGISNKTIPPQLQPPIIESFLGLLPIALKVLVDRQ